MNEEIIEKIAENGQTQEGGTEQTSDKRLSTWLIFAIAGKKFAIRSSEVLEIIGDMSVYRLPFMPAYIEGVINRRGDPYTVINPLAVINAVEGDDIFYKLSPRGRVTLTPTGETIFTEDPDGNARYQYPGDKGWSDFVLKYIRLMSIQH